MDAAKRSSAQKQIRWYLESSGELDGGFIVPGGSYRGATNDFDKDASRGLGQERSAPSPLSLGGQKRSTVRQAHLPMYGHPVTAVPLERTSTRS